MLAIATVMDLAQLLERCAGLERGAEEIYAILATRFPDDRELCEFWQGMAAEEAEHARNLEAWRRLMTEDERLQCAPATGFGEALWLLEEIVRTVRAKAPTVGDADEAFAIALALETSELDAIYRTVLSASPIIRSPQAAEALRRGAAQHHHELVALVRRRSLDPENLLRASMLAAEEA